MANLALINCINLSEFAIRDLGDGRSSLERVLTFAASLPDVGEVICLVASGQPRTGVLEGQSYREVPATPAGLLASIEELLASRGEIESVFYFFGDTPLLDNELARRMWTNHRRYRAEFTFADAYPVGLAPEILRASAVGPIARLAEGFKGAIERDMLFEVIRKDINAFEIETEIPPLDLRLLRIRLAAADKAGFLLLTRLLSTGIHGAGALLVYLQENQEHLRTLPAYLSVQITGGCPQVCSYCPYPDVGGDILSRRDSMSVEDLTSIVEKFRRFAGSGVVNLSPWGEPALHPEIGKVIDSILACDELDLLIETAGLGWDPKLIEELAASFGSRITWIVSLDAQTPETYRSLRGKGFDEAQLVAGLLLQQFPETAFVQAVRMVENEEELEVFYRHWKETTENIIIQKYDHFCGELPQRRVADISPLNRDACWHLKRDLTVLLNGDVPLCREDLKSRYMLGNLLTEEIEEIWQRGDAYYRRHLAKDYPDICRNCDEYYTYNF